MISMVTPMPVIIAIFVTPNDAMAVHRAMQIEPRMIALSAPSSDVGDMSVPTIWKPLQTSGSTACSAIAIAATLMM